MSPMQKRYQRSMPDLERLDTHSAQIFNLAADEADCQAQHIKTKQPTWHCYADTSAVWLMTA